MRTIQTLLLLAFLPMCTWSQQAGNALQFDASNGYVSASLPTVFNNFATNDFTIETWVKPLSNSTSKRVFFAQFDNNNFVSILINSANVPYIFIQDNGTTYSVNSQTQIFSGQWAHVATTWDASSNTIGLYIDGVAIAGISGGSSSLGTDNVMAIGARTDGQQIFNGSIDNLRIWSGIRTLCEINGSMNTRFTSAQPNLVASYDFNEGTAGATNTGITTLPELNGNFDGTLNGFLLTGATSNWVASTAEISTLNNNDGTIYLPETVSACETYTWSNSTTYTSSVSGETYNSTSQGCPVIHSLDLTILQPATSTDVITACDSITWIDGISYAANNSTATYTFAGGAVNGCDSIVTLNLSILHSSTATDVITACNSYTWIDGITYTTDENAATYVLPNAAGCDSLITLNLTIHTIDPAVTVSSTTLTSATVGAAYQWIDCDLNTPIAGATDSAYTATENGNYAVIVTVGSCSDTSACMAVNDAGINKVETLELQLFPNPNNGRFVVAFSEHPDAGSLIRIADATGKIIAEQAATTTECELRLAVQSGYYFLIYQDIRMPFIVK